MKIIGVIPSRYHSTRLPGKPLADICGKPMIQHVYERAVKCACLSQVMVATDDGRIYRTVKGFGGETVLTSSWHRSGTDRIAEAVEDMDVDIVVNIQGDEPLLEPKSIEELVHPFSADDQVPIATLARRIKAISELEDTNSAKVVVDKDDFALYFSRAPIPFCKPEIGSNLVKFLKQIGIYAYRKDFLLKFASLEPSPLEQVEGLEQLRALENGYKIKVVETNYSSLDVDTWEDLEKVREIVSRQPKNSNFLEEIGLGR